MASGNGNFAQVRAYPCSSEDLSCWSSAVAGHECRGVGDAYAIASNYLRKTGAFRYVRHHARCRNHRADVSSRRYNKIRLANKASRNSRRAGASDLCIHMNANGGFHDSASTAIMQTYDFGEPHRPASAEARAKVTEYVAKLIRAGEKDTNRLTVVRPDLFAPNSTAPVIR